MSNQYYQNLWKEAINDLLENYELENYPLDQAIQSVLLNPINPSFILNTPLMPL